MQLSVKVSMIKQNSSEEEEPDKIMLYLKTDIVRVDYGGLERGQHVEMIEHMLNTISCFASHGSGWLVEKISKATINFAKTSPMRAGSYLTLPNDPKKRKFNLGTIETKNTNKCCLHCLNAAYHFKIGPALYKASQGYQKKT